MKVSVWTLHPTRGYHQVFPVFSHGLLLPGGLAAVALAGIPGVQLPQSVLGLLADTGPTQHGVQRSAVDGHIPGHLRVRVGELHKLHGCRNLTTQEVVN